MAAETAATKGLANRRIMRNGQNKRMRGRNQHRKSHNPMARVYESNGPDVKIRGNPSHIAEKYVQLARDAQSSGDPVAAENYYQHAEHYFRLIAAAQEQFRQSNPQGYRPDTDIRPDNDTRDPRDDSFEEGDDDGQPRMGSGDEPFGTREPQPYIPRDAQPYPQHQQRKARATSIGCRPSSPAATRRSRSTIKGRKGQTGTTISRTVSRCIAGAAVIAAARATTRRAARITARAEMEPTNPLREASEPRVL